MSRLRKFISISVGLALSVGLVGAVIYRSDIIDQFRVWQYQPSSEIASLADRASMSESGKYYFYIAHPKLEAADEFNQECRRAEPASALLGCYTQAAHQRESGAYPVEKSQKIPLKRFRKLLKIRLKPQGLLKILQRLPNSRQTK